MKPLFSSLIAAAALLSLAACDMPKMNSQPKVGTLTRSFLLVDGDGRRYGTVEMDPITGGRVFDAAGRQIGTIVTPATTSTVTTVTPIAPIAAAPVTTVVPAYPQ